MRVRHLLLPFVLATTGTLVVSFLGFRLAGTRTSASPAATQSKVAATQGDPTMAAPQQTAATPSSLRIIKREFKSLEDAGKSYHFPIFTPKTLPSGFQLQYIRKYYVAPGFDYLDVQYAMSDGHYLLIEQGVPVGVQGIYKFIPDSHRGELTVKGQTAQWIQGTMLPLNGPASNPSSLVWRNGPIKLGWAIGLGSAPGHPNIHLGFALRSDLLTLDQLVAIANSVRPYP